MCNVFFSNNFYWASQQVVVCFSKEFSFGGKRAYKVDFELYDQAATDFNNIQSKVYIGLQDW